MAFWHDIDYWLGGYCYEFVNAEDLIRYLTEQDFDLSVVCSVTPSRGVIGTGCGEWVFRKTGA